jgi:hypothetical protein
MKILGNDIQNLTRVKAFLYSGIKVIEQFRKRVLDVHLLDFLK